MIAVLLMTLAALGAGAACLRALGVLGQLPVRERAPWSFALGFGMVGWLVFWPAVAQALSPVALAGLLVVCLLGLTFLRGTWVRLARPSWIVAVLLAAFAVVAVLDVMQGIAPPADADSLAYHFALPKLFLAHGGLVFTPRAVEGAVPLLPQMTYLAALGLGGETAMTLSTMVSGWGTAVLVWAISRRWLSPGWALAVALAWKTTPAVIYGAGTGQVEVRTAMFATVAAFAIAEAVVSGRLRWLLVAGLATGFFMGSKYPGLFFAAGAGLVVLMLAPRRIAGAVAFGMAALVGGAQWYGWNWRNTGDPIFPMLWGLLPHGPVGQWSDQAAVALKTVFAQAELILPRTPFWLVAYPFKATFDPHPIFESGRTGLGALGLLLLPFAAIAAWQKRFRGGRLGVAALIVALVYGLWFFFGPSQRVRHLVPLLPVLIIVFVVAAHRLTDVRRVVVIALAATLTLQLAAQAVFSVKYVRALGVQRDVFLAENLAGYSMAQWINANLGPEDKVFHAVRWLNYTLERPYFYGHFLYQDQVGLSDGRDDPARFWNQLRRQGVTHVLFITTAETISEPGMDSTAWHACALVAAGCARLVERQTMIRQGSRTFAGLAHSEGALELVKLDARTCPFERPSH